MLHGINMKSCAIVIVILPVCTVCSVLRSIAPGYSKKVYVGYRASLSMYVCLVYYWTCQRNDSHLPLQRMWSWSCWGRQGGKRLQDRSGAAVSTSPSISRGGRTSAVYASSTYQRINIVMLTGDSVSLPFNPAMTVECLKAEIKKRFGVEQDKQQLMYNDRVVEVWNVNIIQFMCQWRRLQELSFGWAIAHGALGWKSPVGSRGEAPVGGLWGQKLKQFADIVYRFWLEKRLQFENFVQIITSFLTSMLHGGD